MGCSSSSRRDPPDSSNISNYIDVTKHYDLQQLEAINEAIKNSRSKPETNGGFAQTLQQYNQIARQMQISYAQNARPDHFNLNINKNNHHHHVGLDDQTAGKGNGYGFDFGAYERGDFGGGWGDGFGT